MHQKIDPARPEAPRQSGMPKAAVRRRRHLRIAATASAAIALAALGASPALAAVSGGGTQYLADASTISGVIGNVTTWLISILAVLATLMLTIGGVRYVLAAGDPAEVEKAKTCFKSAAMGYCLAVMAPLVVVVLKGIVGGP